MPIALLRQTHLHVLDQLQSRAWDATLFVECGDGWVAEEAWRRCRSRCYVSGVDNSLAAIELARKLRAVAGQLEFLTWDWKTFPFANGSFDHVISSFAFGRHPEPRALARELLRVLRPCGDLYVLEYGEAHGLDAPELCRLLGAAGFADVRQLPHGDGSEADGRAVIIHAQSSQAPPA